MARKRRTSQRQEVTLNLTSMLDVVFLLMIFFLLVTNFTAAELPEMEPPDPVESEAQESGERSRVVINVIPEESTGRAERVRVGLRDIDPGDYGRLTELLRSRRESDPNLQVDLRADRSIRYDQVQPVMNAITEAGIERINLRALMPEDRR